MDIFTKAKSVRLRCHHDKYLQADDDGETVSQDRDGNRQNARWTVEIVDPTGVIRLRSCHGKYLTASNMPLFLGVSGKKVQQTLPHRLGSAVEWEPIREGVKLRLKTHYGLFLRANGRLPPWRNTVTHDIPRRTSVQDWLLWDVDVLEVNHDHNPRPPPPPPESYNGFQPPPPPELRMHSGVDDSFDVTSSEFQNSVCVSGSAPEERVIYYSVEGEEGGDGKRREVRSVSFKGKEVKELKERMEEKIGIHRDEFILCSRNLLNGKLIPIGSDLPSIDSDFHLVVLPRSSKVAKTILEAGEGGVQQ